MKLYKIISLLCKFTLFNVPRSDRVQFKYNFLNCFKCYIVVKYGFHGVLLYIFVSIARDKSEVLSSHGYNC